MKSGCRESTCGKAGPSFLRRGAERYMLGESGPGFSEAFFYGPDLRGRAINRNVGLAGEQLGERKLFRSQQALPTQRIAAGDLLQITANDAIGGDKQREPPGMRERYIRMTAVDAGNLRFAIRPMNKRCRRTKYFLQQAAGSAFALLFRSAVDCDLEHWAGQKLRQPSFKIWDQQCQRPRRFTFNCSYRAQMQSFPYFAGPAFGIFNAKVVNKVVDIADTFHCMDQRWTVRPGSANHNPINA